MYLSHFGLNQSPFSITPNPVFFYEGSRRREILDALIYTITHGEGIIKVTGEVGSGKTMLCRMLERLLPSSVEVIYLLNPKLASEDVAHAIAGELGLATGGKRADEVIRLLQSDLIAKHAAGKQVVLLIEEAQAMSLDTLEEIRLFSNLETAHHKLLQIVLFGQPELDDNLNLPHMRQLKERITHSFNVPQLRQQVIPEFLMFRMRAAGYRGPDIFSRGAIRMISAISNGIVRRISILADKSMLAAFADNTHSIRRKHVRAAIRDSEFSSSAATRRRRKILLGMLLVAASSVAVSAGSMLLPRLNLPFHVPAVGVTVASPPEKTAPPLPVKPAMDTTPMAPTGGPLREAENGVPKTIEPKPDSDTARISTAAAKPASGLLEKRRHAAQTWLETGEAERYSIQLALLNMDNPMQTEKFLEKVQGEIGLEEVYVFPSRIIAAPTYGIAYGDFATRAQALAAITKLAAQWGYRPQLRTIGGIRQDIDIFQGAQLK